MPVEVTDLKGPKSDDSSTNLPEDPLRLGTVVYVSNDTSEHKGHVGRTLSLGRNGDVTVELHLILWRNEGHRKGSRLDINVPRSHLTILPRPPKAAGVAVDIEVNGARIDVLLALMGERGWGLHNGLAQEIGKYLLLPPLLSPTEVPRVSASSSRGDFALSEVLNTNDHTWWISAAGSMPNGCGSEWLQLNFQGERCIRFLGLRIPPLPQGPLSVREFRVFRKRPCQFDAGIFGIAAEEASWVPVGGPLKTADVSWLQEFALVPPVTTTAIRIVCTKTAASGRLAGFMGVNCVGLFQVKCA